MFLDKSGRVCLATLEYAFVETPSLTTHCPSCGLTLIIRHEHFVNRVTSLGLIIGISALIGYHLGTNHHLIRRFCRKLLQMCNVLDSNDHDKNLDHHTTTTSNNNNNNNNLSNPKLTTSVQQVFSFSRRLDSRRSNGSDDSSLDIFWPNYEQELMEILTGQQYSSDVDDDGLILMDRFDDPHQPPQPPNGNIVRSRTVDKIDQVLHQIDDIKKSIVEIDGELYHVSGSKYANFNPDFLTLNGDYGLEELDDNNRQTRHRNHHRHPSRTLSPREEELVCRPVSPGKFEAASNFLVELVAPSTGLYSNDDERELFPFSEKQQQQRPLERRISRMSFTSSCENLPLEWDESECDYLSFHPYYDDYDRANSKRSFLPIETVANGGEIETGTGMTDEQKLKNMPDLLEEAKHLGLLNNIIDACLQQSPTTIKIQEAKMGAESIRVGDHHRHDGDDDDEEEEEPGD